jgi:hypothetical protein
MKKIILMGAMALATISAQAQDFKTVLEKTFLAFDTTWDQPTKIEQSNKLALIAKKWPDEWVAHYYVAYSKVNLAYMEKDNAKKDAYLDEADKEKEEAVSILKKENDETFVLAAMIANARMSVDPMARWQKYGAIFKESLESAKEINADNPRMYYITGTSKFFTPKAYGGGKKAAMPYFEKADGLFAKEAGTPAASDITKPHWGKKSNDYFMMQCKVEDKDAKDQ